jgi:hypothetical protein
VTKHGNINLPQKLLTLDAEELSLSYKDPTRTRHEEGVANATRMELKTAYDKAIVAAMKSGFTQDAALAAHLASETFSAERDLFWEWVVLGMGARLLLAVASHRRGSIFGRTAAITTS